MSRRRPSLAPWKRGIAAAFALLLGAVPVRAADPPAAIVVFDGSGSMWGRMEGERPAKFAIARDALKAPMAAMQPDIRLGLASYGHRRQADCNAVEVIVPPEPGSAERIGGALGKLNPRGKGPVANGLREPDSRHWRMLSHAPKAKTRHWAGSAKTSYTPPAYRRCFDSPVQRCAVIEATSISRCDRPPRVITRSAMPSRCRWWWRTKPIIFIGFFFPGSFCSGVGLH